MLICNANLSMFLDAEEGWPPSPAGPSESVLDELRAEHELAWRAWLLSEEQVQAGDLKSAPEIPYPTGPRKGNLLHIHRNMDFKTYLRRAVLRWHPGDCCCLQTHENFLIGHDVIQVTSDVGLQTNGRCFGYSRARELKTPQRQAG